MLVIALTHKYTSSIHSLYRRDFLFCIRVVAAMIERQVLITYCLDGYAPIIYFKLLNSVFGTSIQINDCWKCWNMHWLTTKISESTVQFIIDWCLNKKMLIGHELRTFTVIIRLFTAGNIIEHVWIIEWHCNFHSKWNPTQSRGSTVTRSIFLPPGKEINAVSRV